MTDVFRVLYVDDEPSLLEITRIFLESEGTFTVETIASAREALALLKTQQFDAIVSDYHMPEMDGITFLKHLKATGDTTPFIIFTGRGREEVVIEALNNGADFYLQKGGEPKAQFAELSNKIRYAITRKRAETALRESEERVRKKLDALLSPAGDIGSLDLGDVLDVSAVQLMMNDFYTLTGIGIGIIDLHGKVLVATGWQDICTQFHRQNPETCRRCTESDLVLAEGTEPGSFRMYKCKNHMWDIVTPLHVGGTHIGNIFLGQFLFEDEPVADEIFRSQARQYGFDEAAYLAALERVPRWSREKVETTMRFYTRVGGMISSLSYSNLSLARSVTARDALLKTLAESEERSRDFITTTADIFWQTDGQAKFSFVSPQVEKILGYRPEELVGQSPVAFLEQGPTRSFWENFEVDGVNSRDLVSHDSVWRHKNGSRVVLETRAVPVFHADGSFAGFRGIDRDITRRKQAEARFAELNNAFLEFTPDPIGNINIMTGLAGRMLQGTCALYNRLEGGLLCSLGMWNTPSDFSPCDQPEGHICNDIILKGGSSSTIITDLPKTSYAETDPNVRKYQLQTYIGIPVKIGEKFLGSLCVVYQDSYSPSAHELEVLSFLARAIAIEDERRSALQALRERDGLVPRTG